MKLTNRHLGLLQWAVSYAMRNARFGNKAYLEHLKMVEGAQQAVQIVRENNGALTEKERDSLTQERDEAVATLKRATENIQGVHRHLQEAVYRIQDLLLGDDGQASAEARKFLEQPGVKELMAKGESTDSYVPGCRATLTSFNPRHLHTQALLIEGMYEQILNCERLGGSVHVEGGIISGREMGAATNVVTYTVDANLRVTLDQSTMTPPSPAQKIAEEVRSRAHVNHNPMAPSSAPVWPSPCAPDAGHRPDGNGYQNWGGDSGSGDSSSSSSGDSGGSCGGGGGE